MKRNHKIAIGCLTAVIGFIFVAYLGAWMLAPGSYPRAETYVFDIPEDSLITIINEVKNENPELKLDEKVMIPEGKKFELADGRKDSSDYWYSIYFYYPDKNEILYTWTRPKNKNSTTFAFVGVNSGLTLGNWRIINENFWWWKNQPDIDEFEKRVLKKIKEKTENQQTNKH